MGLINLVSRLDYIHIWDTGIENNNFVVSLFYQCLARHSINSRHELVRRRRILWQIVSV